jgi:hypothetical protein
MITAKNKYQFSKLRLVNPETSIKKVQTTSHNDGKSKGLQIQEKKADIRLNIDTGAIQMPYLDERFNLKSSFDSID